MRATAVSGDGVLVTGVYGTGKTSVVEEMAGIMEAAGLNYGAIDLDWLRWFDADIDEARYQTIFLANVTSITTAYLDAGVERFALAGAIADQAALAALREALPFPVRVVRLTLPLEEIAARLGSAVTAERADDLRVAAEWLAKGIGRDIEDIAVTNDKPVRETALEVLGWLDWMPSP
ncbi:MAG: hypothetical protein AAF563_10345 [Pseudomonadota bacterium]